MPGFVLLATAILVLAQWAESRHASRSVESRPSRRVSAPTIDGEQAVGAGLTSLAARVAFDARKLATMDAPVQGHVLRIQVAAGDRVNEGALLLTLSSDVAAANVQGAQPLLTQAGTERGSEPARPRRVDGAGTPSGDQYSAPEEYPIRSPIAGVVIEQNVAVGDRVDLDSAQPLVTVADLSTLWVMTNVNERELAQLHQGDQARVRVPAFPGREFDGRITYIGDTIEPLTHEAVVRIEIPNGDSRLRPGMIATVDIIDRKIFDPGEAR